ncbi:small multi-drug export protein [Tetragenococcus halophilus]|uniref:small multi-drug export protein n=1 Tax=Tetragenococcus halophilus TaxID=51669 RepID=UPI0030E97034
MSPIAVYIIVMLIAATPFLEPISIIPIGIVAGLNPWVVTILSVVGNVITFLLSVSLADKLKGWWEGKHKIKKENRRKKAKIEKASQLWEKYGLTGLILIHPVTFGSHTAALLALSLGGVSKKKVIVWIGGSIIIWSIAIAIFSFISADFINSLIGTDSFLSNWFNLNL